MSRRVNVLQPGHDWTAVVEHSPEHFNDVCNATVPEYWEAELITYPRKDKEAHRLLHPRPGVRHRLYGTAQTGASDALLDLLTELERMSFSGTLHITDACICEACGILRGTSQNFGKVLYGD